MLLEGTLRVERDSSMYCRNTVGPLSISCLPYSVTIISSGMQPVAFSVGEAAAGRPGWVRVGEYLYYFL